MLQFTGLFMRFFPKLYDHYDCTLEDVCAISPFCVPPYRDLPLASFTLNVGSKSVCFPHVDSTNSVLGTCLVSPAGTYDHTRGGHLIIHDWKAVIELPPGSIILFPSAIVTHENVGIQHHEERRAITGFTSASFFQWVNNGFSPMPHMDDKERVAYGQAEWEKAKKRLSRIYSFL